MSLANTRVLAWLMGGLLLLPVGGCGIMADLFDPGLALGFGFDPATVQPEQGTVLVAFHNTTRYPAQFFAFESVDAQDLRRSSRNFSVEVEGGDVRNEVLDCPVGLISPGTLQADYSVDSTAVIVTGEGFGEIRPYGGPPLMSGSSYECGDVVEIRLATTGTGEGEELSVVVRVIPGG